jgi:flavin-dependent dehydrogenase
MPGRPDSIIIAGGGLAGGAAATWLARAGRRVRLLERDMHPGHKICGEFLSWEAQAWLRDLGVDLDALGAGRIDHVRLVAKDVVAEAPLGFVARSVSRLRLDAALLEQAAGAGVEVVRGCQVRELQPDGTLQTSHGPERPATLLVATGKHGLRGMPREREGTLDHQLGFKTYFRLAPEQRAALAGRVELILFEGGYAGLQLVEREQANLCFLVSPERFRRAGGAFAPLLADLADESPHLARRLAGAIPLLDRPLAISNMPYGFLWRPGPAASPRVYPIGDQATCIPSFTGDGMGLALHGARLAARAILSGETPAGYGRRLAADARGAVSRASRLQRGIGETARRHLMVARLARLFPPLLTLGARLTRLGPKQVRAAGASASEAAGRDVGPARQGAI